MSQQNIILPNAPLVIVDRRWRNSKRFAGQAAAAGNNRFDSCLNGSRSDDIAVTLIKQSPSRSTACPRSSDRDRPEEQQHVVTKAAQDLKFINLTEPSQSQDPDVQALVRSHAMKWVGRDQNARKKPREKSSHCMARSTVSPHAQKTKALKAGPSVSSRPNMVLPGSTTSLYGVLPFDSNPGFYNLLNYYVVAVAEAIYPFQSHLSFNPVKTAWLPLALTDEVLFHTVLLSSAKHLSLVKGHQNSGDQNTLMDLTLRHLGRRLSNQKKPIDGTLAAVACLALVESSQGNLDKWKVHMTGLIEMVRMKGGIDSVDESLQMKIYRADIEGAAESVSPPYLSPPKRTHPPIYTTIPPAEAVAPTSEFLDIIISADVHPRMTSTFLDLFRFTRAIEYALGRQDVSFHPRAFDEDMIIMQHELLSNPHIEANPMNEACRLGALIYLKTTAPMSSGLKARKLKSSLINIPQDPKMAPLLLWLFFMGAIASRDAEDRTWFTQEVVGSTILRGELTTREGFKKALSKLLWVDLAHEGLCRQWWNEIEVLQAVKPPTAISDAAR